MLTKTLDLDFLDDRDSLAKAISTQWETYNTQRQPWLDEKKELRNFIFATDTSGTIETDVPWKNRTTLPKLCQIRDNLHANYISALFPNDDWLKWEGYSLEDETKAKRDAIQAYMGNKARESGLRDVCSKALYDYIDYGMAVGDVVWANEIKEDPITGELVHGYVGPKAVRVAAADIVFNPTAVDFKHTPKITRSLVSLGELEALSKTQNEQWIGEAIAKAKENRQTAYKHSRDDFAKVEAFQIDGFGNLWDYYSSGFVEVLEFEGTLYDMANDELLDDHVITVIDRQYVARKEGLQAWQRGGLKVMTGWRKRPDNLYPMGPLDNLVGMQYRVDHLENAKADAWDLVVTPMFKIIGDVDEFEFEPGGEVHIAEGGDIQPLTKPVEAIQATNELVFYMNIMEEMAGAPKQAMGIRTPGEKTAFEVQALENAAGRIFQEKITQFEIEFLEPLLNSMLEMAVRNMDQGDVIRVMDDDLGVATFKQITKDDVTAKGKLRPVGARHFAQRAQLLQNLAGVANSPVWQKIERHVSDKGLAKMVEDSLQLQRFALVSDNAAMFEQQEAQRLQQQMQEDLDVESITPLPNEEEVIAE